MSATLWGRGAKEALAVNCLGPFLGRSAVRGSTESAAGGRRADYPEAELLRQTSAHVPVYPCSVLNADFTQSAVSTVCRIR